MILVYIFIIGLPCLLIYFIARKISKSRHVLREGIAVDAVVRQVVTQRFSRTSMDILTLEYRDAGTGIIYPAKATTLAGKQRTGDTMPLWYLSNDPSKYVLDNGKGYWGVLIFCIVLLAFTIFASFKIDEMVRSGNYY